MVVESIDAQGRHLWRRDVLPDMSDGGYQSEGDIAAVPGVRIIDAVDIAPGPSLDVYAYSRETAQRNLYRVPVP